MTKGELERVARICKENKAWLIVDDTYEDFLYDGREHHCLGDNHIIHIFSFSKVNCIITYCCINKFNNYKGVWNDGMACRLHCISQL